MCSLNWRQKLATSFLYATRKTLNSRISYAANTRKTTGQQVRDYCAAKGIAYNNVMLSMPATSSVPPPSLHFVSHPNSSTDGPTVLFVHGGGYLFPMVGECHIPLALHMATSAKAKDLAYLEYTLSSTLRYPGQLAQIVRAVKHILEQGVLPSHLIIAGDSAGGHLVTALIAHIKQPCPSVEPIDLKGQQIRAVLLLSPWLDMTPADTYGAANEAYDVFSQEQLRNMAKLLGTSTDNLWSEPLRAKAGKELLLEAFTEVRGIVPIVSKVLITAGEREVLLESCTKFAESFVRSKTVVMDGKGNSAIRNIALQEPSIFAVGPGEVHVQAGVDIATGYYGGGTMIALTTFLQSLHS